MDNNLKICSKCNAQNDPNANFCNSCGSKFDEKQLSTNNTNQPANGNLSNQKLTEKTDENTNGNILGIIALVLFYATSLFSTIISTSVRIPIISKILESAGTISSLAGLVIMIYGRIKYPKNILLKVTMWIMIVTIIVGVLLLFFFAFACLSCIAPCSADFAAGKCD